MRLAKSARLTLRGEFLEVQGRGRKLHAGAAYLVLALPNGRSGPRLGVTVSRRVGNAVVRNRVKRWVRHAFRTCAGQLPSADLVVIARGQAPGAGFMGALAALTPSPRAGCL